MASARPLTRSPTSDIDDTTPFLGGGGGSSSPSSSSSSEDSGNSSSLRFVQRQSLRQAARFLRQASSRRVMRELSMMVRETAAEQLEERQSDWAYSKPVVILDVLWNFAFVVAAAAVLVISRRESPDMPLWLWIVRYAMQCGLHVACVCVEYQRRQRRGHSGGSAVSGVERGSLGSAEDESSRSGMF